MRRAAQPVLAIVMATAGIANAAESDTTVVGGFDFGFKQLELTVGPDSGGGGGDTFDPFFVSLNPYVTIATGRFYTSLGYDKAISLDPKARSQTRGGVSRASTLTFSRSDATLTFGYRVGESISLFAGWVRGENSGVSTAEASGGGIDVTDINYTETGPFAGIAYTHGFGDKGSLGFTLAYAKLDGELSTTRDYTGGVEKQNSSGDTTGYSASLTWTGSLTGSLAYRVGLKALSYKMPESSTNPQEITEQYNNFFFGIMNYF
jgi:hypothetical protein